MNWEDYYKLETKPSWHYIEYDTWDPKWMDWLRYDVGQEWVDYRYDDCGGHNFICFSREEDATAFTLKFKFK